MTGNGVPSREQNASRRGVALPRLTAGLFQKDCFRRDLFAAVRGEDRSAPKKAGRRRPLDAAVPRLYVASLVLRNDRRERDKIALPPCYSVRKACMGSVEAARRAGT